MASLGGTREPTFGGNSGSGHGARSNARVRGVLPRICRAMGLRGDAQGHDASGLVMVRLRRPLGAITLRRTRQGAPPSPNDCTTRPERLRIGVWNVSGAYRVPADFAEAKSNHGRTLRPLGNDAKRKLMTSFVDVRHAVNSGFGGPNSCCAAPTVGSQIAATTTPQTNAAHDTFIGTDRKALKWPGAGSNALAAECFPAIPGRVERVAGALER